MAANVVPELRKAPLLDVPDEILEQHARILATKEFLQGDHFVAYLNPHYVSTHHHGPGNVKLSGMEPDKGTLSSTSTPKSKL
jgi:hypothetical protein